MTNPTIVVFQRCFSTEYFFNNVSKEVDCVACVSETTLSRLKVRFPRWFAHRKAVVVHNCVTIGSIEPVLPVGQQCKFVLMVAQHRANKNISRWLSRCLKCFYSES